MVYHFLNLLRGEIVFIIGNKTGKEGEGGGGGEGGQMD